MTDSFIASLAKPQPDPGGGAAAAYAATVALSLLEKVIRLEHRRHQSDAELNRQWGQMLMELSNLHAVFAVLRESDVEAYRKFLEARSSGDPGQLLAAIGRMVQCPMEIMTAARQALSLTSQAGKLCSKHLVADLQVVVELIGATLKGAYHIAYANMPLLQESTQWQNLNAELSKAMNQGQIALTSARDILSS
jgi:formiminotetrahydrofolate cyclodeaminase